MKIIKDISGIKETEIIEIMDANHRIATMTKAEIENLRIQEETNSGSPTYERIIFTEPPKEITEKNCNNINIDFEDEVRYYLEELNKLTKEELPIKLARCLPSQKNYNYDKIILRLKAEMIKNIKEIKELLESEKNSITVEDMEMFKQDILLNKEKINMMDNLSITKNDTKEETTKENRLIYVSTTGGNIRVLEELDKIPVEYYERFLGLLNSIKDGTFKNVKRFTTINNGTYGLSEVRDFKTRVIFDRIKENNYAIITNFVKKCDNDKGYIERLKKVSAEYRIQYNSLLENITNEEFILNQEQIDKEVIGKLSQYKMQKTKKKVK